MCVGFCVLESDGFKFDIAPEIFGAISSFYSKGRKFPSKCYLSSHPEETNEKFLRNICTCLWNHIAPDPSG